MDLKKLTLETKVIFNMWSAAALKLLPLTACAKYYHLALAFSTSQSFRCGGIVLLSEQR